MRFVLLGLALGVLAVPIGLIMATLRVARLARLRAAGLRVAGDLVWDPAAFYTTGHVWLRLDPGGVRLGLDDLARRLLPSGAVLELPAVGVTLAPGDPLAHITCPGHAVKLRSPLGGRVLAALPSGPFEAKRLLNHPHGRGWMVTVEATRLPGKGLLRGEPARAWLARERERLVEILSGALAATEASDRELLEEGAGLLTKVRWAAVCHQFLGGD